MSEKEFEELYSKIKEEETPDLWDRIERSLEVQPQKKKYGKWIISCSTLAASIVIFFLIVPLISTQKPKQNNAEIKNNSEVEDFAVNNDCVTEELEEKNENIVDKENVPIDNTIKNNEEKSVNTKGDFADKESLKSEINTKLEKEGIVLKEVNVEKIEEFEVVETKNLPDKLQIVVQEIEKLNKTQKYYIDLEDNYYVKISKKVFKISK